MVRRRRHAAAAAADRPTAAGTATRLRPEQKETDATRSVSRDQGAFSRECCVM